MFKYDSTHGIFKGTVKVVDESILEINGKRVQVTLKRYHISQSNMMFYSNGIVYFFAIKFVG